jgi:hypothetical protein
MIAKYYLKNHRKDIVCKKLLLKDNKFVMQIKTRVSISSSMKIKKIFTLQIIRTFPI